jgi:DeoR/GlpR family transcriptional regulator of sugar metabolism
MASTTPEKEIYEAAHVIMRNHLLQIINANLRIAAKLTAEHSEDCLLITGVLLNTNSTLIMLLEAREIAYRNAIERFDGFDQENMLHEIKMAYHLQMAKTSASEQRGE